MPHSSRSCQAEPCIVEDRVTAEVKATRNAPTRTKRPVASKTPPNSSPAMATISEYLGPMPKGSGTLPSRELKWCSLSHPCRQAMLAPTTARRTSRTTFECSSRLIATPEEWHNLAETPKNSHLVLASHPVADAHPKDEGSP